MDGIVYLITNTINGKKYVGSTTKTLEERMRRHKDDTNSKTKSHYPMYQDMKTHGITAFNIEPITKMKYFDIKELWMVEDAYISIHDTIHNGYNKKYNAFDCHKETEMGKEYNARYREAHREKINAKQSETDKQKHENLTQHLEDKKGKFSDPEYRRLYYKTKVQCKHCNKFVSRKHMPEHTKKFH